MSDILELLTRSGAYVYKGKLRLPTYTMAGSYPILYFTRGMDTLCADCATTDYFEWLYSLNTVDGWQHDPPTNCDVYWEGPDEICIGCNKPIPSAYGDPWAEETEGDMDYRDPTDNGDNENYRPTGMG